eukprot:4790641-Karenia_brevis.AAC.1
MDDFMISGMQADDFAASAFQPIPGSIFEMDNQSVPRDNEREQAPELTPAANTGKEARSRSASLP